MAAALRVMDDFRLGAVLILNPDRQVQGIITDGDIRHALAQGIVTLAQTPVQKFMTPTPHCLTTDAFLYDALNLMETHEITVLAIVGPGNRLQGFLHLHDILGKGSFKFNGGT